MNKNLKAENIIETLKLCEGFMINKGCSVNDPLTLKPVLEVIAIMTNDLELMAMGVIPYPNKLEQNYQSLADQSQKVTWAIESCGASPELTHAVTLSSTLTAKLRNLEEKQ